MAHSKELWEKAKGYYEAGLSLSKIETKTKIVKSQISRVAKKQQWQQGKNSDYIEAKEIIATKKATESNTSLLIADEVADDNIRQKNLIHGATEEVLSRIQEMAEENTKQTVVKIKEYDGKSSTESIEVVDIKLDSSDLKNLVDATDKASVTLGVNQRHANSQVQINNTNAQQTNVKSLEDFYDEQDN